MFVLVVLLFMPLILSREEAVHAMFAQVWSDTRVKDTLLSCYVRLGEVLLVSREGSPNRFHSARRAVPIADSK